MKKLLIFFVFILLINLNSFAQLTMTHGDVYNYNVGDVFIIRSYGKDVSTSFIIPTDTLYEKTTILNKYFSASSDTVFYSFIVKSKYVH